jgi:hypothetical protein
MKIVLPFTVTKSVTSQEMSIAIESRDANHAFGEVLWKKGRRFHSMSLECR